VTDDAYTDEYPYKLGPTFDITVPHSARVWNYWLGGKDNFPVDRVAGEEILKVFPEIAVIAQVSRAFLARAVRFLAGEAGIRQFLDVGTGLPTVDNTHEVAQRVAPTARIVYIDNDPMVLAHARALLVGTPEGATAYVDADARNTDKILADAARILDFTQPVAVMLLGILGHIDDDETARAIVEALMAAVPPGSYLTVNDGTQSKERDEAERVYDDTGGVPYHARTPEQISGFFAGLDILEPGVVSTPLWRPDPGDAPVPVAEHCGVGRKP
jgi:hypothetical protein